MLYGFFLVIYFTTDDVAESMGKENPLDNTADKVVDTINKVADNEVVKGTTEVAKWTIIPWALFFIITIFIIYIIGTLRETM